MSSYTANELLVRSEKIETFPQWLKNQLINFNIANVGLLIAMIILTDSAQNDISTQRAQNAQLQLTLQNTQASIAIAQGVLNDVLLKIDNANGVTMMLQKNVTYANDQIGYLSNLINKIKEFNLTTTPQLIDQVYNTSVSLIQAKQQIVQHQSNIIDILARSDRLNTTLQLKPRILIQNYGVNVGSATTANGGSGPYYSANVDLNFVSTGISYISVNKGAGVTYTNVGAFKLQAIKDTLLGLRMYSYGIGSFNTPYGIGLFCSGGTTFSQVSLCQYSSTDVIIHCAAFIPYNTDTSGVAYSMFKMSKNDYIIFTVNSYGSSGSCGIFGSLQVQEYLYDIP